MVLTIFWFAFVQAVDHPYLVVYSATAAAAAREKPPSFDPKTTEEVCGICHDPAEDPVVCELSGQGFSSIDRIDFE